LPDTAPEFGATVQQFVLAGVVEAPIVLSIVSFELCAAIIRAGRPLFAGEDIEATSCGWRR